MRAAGATATERYRRAGGRAAAAIGDEGRCGQLFESRARSRRAIEMRSTPPSPIAK